MKPFVLNGSLSYERDDSIAEVTLSEQLHGTTSSSSLQVVYLPVRPMPGLGRFIYNNALYMTIMPSWILQHVRAEDVGNPDSFGLNLAKFPTVPLVFV